MSLKSGAKGTSIPSGMHWKTKEKLKRSVNEKIAACPSNKSLSELLSAEERIVYAERFSDHWALSISRNPVDWLMESR